MHRFAVGGMVNGLALMWDYKTGTYWDHITGEAVHGPLKGEQLDVWGIEITTVAAALAEYEAPELHRSTNAPIAAGLMQWMTGSDINMVRNGAGRLSKLMTVLGFRRTMPSVDARLPEMTQGLGVFEGEQGVFYPLDRIPADGLRDTWQGKPIMIRVGENNRLPYAVYLDDENTRPMQLLMRWYGFCLTFSDVRIYGDERTNTGA